MRGTRGSVAAAINSSTVRAPDVSPDCRRRSASCFAESRSTRVSIPAPPSDIYSTTKTAKTGAGIPPFCRRRWDTVGSSQADDAETVRRRPARGMRAVRYLTFVAQQSNFESVGVYPADELSFEDPLSEDAFDFPD